MTLEQLLKQNAENGITEYRLAYHPTDEGTGVIFHPAGVNGTTVDLTVEGDAVRLRLPIAAVDDGR